MNPATLLFKGINRKKLTKSLLDAQQKLWENEQELQILLVETANGYSLRSSLQKQDQNLIDQINSTLHQLKMPSHNAYTIAELGNGATNAKSQLEVGDKQQIIEEQTVRNQIGELNKLIEGINQQLNDIKQDVRKLEESIVAEAQVVATTISKTFMSPVLSERRFDVVIIDEVSMAPLPAVYIAASRANSSVVAVGDPQQLAPISAAKDNKKLSATEQQLAKSWLSTDLFTKIDITLNRAKEGYRNSTILTKQSRMHPDISFIARKHIYENILQYELSRVPKEDFSGVEPGIGKHLLLCDTSDASPVAIRPEYGSRFNVYHALCSLAIAHQVLLSLPLDSSNQEGKERIGIVTPYKKQERMPYV